MGQLWQGDLGEKALVLQLWCHSSAPARHFNSAPIKCNSSSLRNSSMETDESVCAIEVEVKMAYIEKIVHPRSVIGPFLWKWGLQILSLISPNSTILIGLNGAALIGRWRCKWGHSCTAPIGQISFLGALIRVNSEGRRLGNPVCRFSLKCRVCEHLCIQWLLDFGCKFELN